MSADDSSSVPSIYAANFRIHEETVRANLSGRLPGYAPLLPAFFHPAAYWTSSEKDLFFHGLAIYSRLRPDLIAEHIKTKSTLDVHVYLHALQTALSQAEADGLEPFNRCMIEPAMEMSERWVNCEEAFAEDLLGGDTCPWIGREDGSSPLVHCTCHVNEHGHDSELKNELGADLPKERIGYLCHMDPTCLMVLENITREAEAKKDHEIQRVTPSGRQTSSPEIELHNGQDNHSSSPESVRGSAPPESSLLTDGPLTDISTSQSLEAPVIPSDELRRLQKRLHMRRKRAEAKGKIAIIEEVKLRPGRQARLRKESKPRAKTYKPRKTESPSPSLSHEDTDNHLEEAETMYEAHSKGGLTRPYRIKQVFLGSGVDAPTISEMNLDFFHLSTLGRLLRLYNSLNDPPRPLDMVSISADGIQFLKRILVEFVSKIVRQVISSKEQEIRLKGMMKVWKFDREEISAENIVNCLNETGLEHLNKEKYFANMLDPEGSEIPQPDRAVGAGSKRYSAEPTQSEIILSSPPHDLDISFFDDILPGSLDSDALQKELEEEKTLNGEDEALSRDYERHLWKEYY